MNRDNILRLAQQADLWWLTNDERIAAVERFANLVAATERESYENYTGILCNTAAAYEREACAKIVENYTGAWNDEGYALAQTIRARGEK